MQYGTTHVIAKPYTEWEDGIVCVPACMSHVSMNVDTSLWNFASVQTTQVGSL